MSHSHALYAVTFALLFSAPAGVTSQSRSSSSAAPAAGTPVLWVDRGDPAALDLTQGPGSADLAPAPPFTFVEEDKSGTQPKLKIRDQRGIEWTVKIGPEAQSETASTRLLWAAGYFADEAYFLPEAQIQNMVGLSRKADEVKPGGLITQARFEPNRSDQTKLGTWEWEENPFLGTRELDGLKIVMMLLNNWDARDDNNRIIRVARPGAAAEDRYIVSDLGATLGKTGGVWQHTKNDVKDYVASDFVDGVEQGIVKFHYRVRPKGLGTFAILYPPHLGRVNDLRQAMRGIKSENARWIGFVLARLTDQQLRDAFAAAAYDEPTITAYVGELRERIRQLTSLADVTLRHD